MHEAHGWRSHHAILVDHGHVHRLRVHGMAMLRVRPPSRHLQRSTTVLLGTSKLHFLHSSQPLQSAQHSCRHDKCTSSGSTPPTRIQLEASCMSHMTPHASMQTTLEIRWGANNSTPKGKHAEGG